MYKLQVWPDSPNDEGATQSGQIFDCILKEWEAQVTGIKKAAAEEAEEAEKGDDGKIDKDDDKQAKLKPKQLACCSKKKKDTSSKKVELLNDNLDEYFGQSQSQNTQKTFDVTPVDTRKRSEEAKLKNNPDGSSHRSVEKLPPGSAGEHPPKHYSKSKQLAQDSADSSHGKVHKLP